MYIYIADYLNNIYIYIYTMGFGRSMKLICTAIAANVLEGRRAWQINVGKPAQDLDFFFGG